MRVECQRAPFTEFFLNFDVHFSGPYISDGNRRVLILGFSMWSTMGSAWNLWMTFLLKARCSLIYLWIKR